MTNILFVCHGNICRSPMAEFIFRDMVNRRGLASRFQCASAATSAEEIGNPVYPPARRKLAELGISTTSKRAVQLAPGDYARYDLLLGVEKRHVDIMRRMYGNDPDGKIARLLDYSDHPRDIADPWYTDDFDAACADITEGCAALLEALLKGRA